jgi:hypothetical protein
MARCEVCGNDYDKTMEISVAGAAHTFDSFECAIHALAPRCDTCGVRIIGHGLEAGGAMFCCARCGEQKGHGELTDRAPA